MTKLTPTEILRKAIYVVDKELENGSPVETWDRVERAVDRSRESAIEAIEGLIEQLGQQAAAPHQQGDDLEDLWDYGVGRGSVPIPEDVKKRLQQAAPKPGHPCGLTCIKCGTDDWYGGECAKCDAPAYLSKEAKQAAPPSTEGLTQRLRDKGAYHRPRSVEMDQGYGKLQAASPSGEHTGRTNAEIATDMDQVWRLLRVAGYSEMANVAREATAALAVAPSPVGAGEILEMIDAVKETTAPMPHVYRQGWEDACEKIKAEIGKEDK